MSQDSMSVLEPFRSTLDQLDLQLEELLAANSDESRQELAEQLCEGWQILAEQLVEAGTPALMDLIALYAENLDLLLASRENGLPASEQSLLRRWHEACRHYLQAPADEKVIAAWVSLLHDPAWQEPLHEDDAAELINGLVEFAEFMTAAPTVPSSEEVIHDDIGLQNDDEPFIEPLADRPVEPVDLALVHMISDVFGKVADDLTHTLAKFNCASLTDYQQSLSANDFLLENINKACETVGLFGLSYVFRRLWLNVVAKAADDHDYDAECNLFGIALILIQEYLTDIGNDTHCSALVRHLHEPGWRRPLPDAMQGSLFEALNVSVTDSAAQRARLERTIAGPDDVSLAIPGEVDGELVQALLHELPVLTENFSAAILAIIGADASQSRLLEAQRIAHTLKGACNTIGVHGIANLTHCLEAILEALNTEQALPGRELGTVLLDAADCVAAMSECLQGEGTAPEQALAVLQQVLDWDYRIKKEGLTGLDVSNGAPKADVPAETENTGHDDDRAKAKTHIPSVMLDQIIEVAAEAGSIGERVHDKIGNLLNGSDEVRELTWRLSELVAEMDRLVNIQSVTARDSRGSQVFDTLELEQYSEVHTCLSRLAEAAADVREQNAQMHRQLLDGKNLLIEQRNVQKEHLEHVQNLRLVPVQRIVPRCQRIVRQTARMTGKEVELQISGENTLIDSEILNGLTDALMHLLRNAVDHGIEAPESRVQAGKPGQGTIRLSFANDRNALTISCEDDGSGLDTAKIGATAQARGWITDQQALSDEQIQRLIFRPGFSTKERVSHVSGRGIGMDAIQAQVASMNGVMDLASKPGCGLSVTINVPSNRYDAPMILVKIDGQTYAVSEHGIEHIFCALDGRLKVETDGSFHYQVEECRYSADTLDHLLGLGGKNRMPDKAAGLLFKARNGAEQVVLVDQVIGYKNLMIRPFGDYLKGVYGVLGGVMLGSGQIAPVIDLFELISDAERRANADQFTELTPARPHAAKTLALVVDDSLSARKATVQLLKDAGFEVQTAIDGLDAIEKIEAQKPDIILSDLEMPRMNGIELTRYLRAMPDLKAIPLIMITSRSSEKHRDQADNAGVTLYLTKPFSEDDLIIKLNGLLERKLIQAA
ncbi:response regulator [Methylobacter sp. Wu1]|uniref:hybrid sensor histidine kinase/response regulator n=1 Tax=Methylobacter sp. Wu1 TaxID=3119359 RepID=UPI002F93EF23